MQTPTTIERITDRHRNSPDVRVLGFQSVTRGACKLGKLAVFHRAGARIPEGLREAMPAHYPHAVITAKETVDGVIGYGLCVPIEDFPEEIRARLQTLPEGASVDLRDDATDESTVTPDPYFLIPGLQPRSEPDVREVPDIVAEFRGHAVAVTHKIDGIECTVIRQHGEPVIIGCDDGEAEAALRECPGIDRIPEGYAVRGVVAGPQIRKNKGGWPRAFFALDVWRQYYEGDTFEEMHQRIAGDFARAWGLSLPFTTQRGWVIDERHTLASFEALAYQKYANGSPAAGVVIRTEAPALSRTGARLAVTVINPLFEQR